MTELNVFASFWGFHLLKIARKKLKSFSQKQKYKPPEIKKQTSELFFHDFISYNLLFWVT